MLKSKEKVKEPVYKDSRYQTVPKFCKVCGSKVERSTEAIRTEFDEQTGEKITIYKVWHACTTPPNGFIDDWHRAGHYSHWDHDREQRG